MSANFGDSNNIINVSAIVIFQIAGVTDRYIDFGNLVDVTGNLGITKKEAEWSINGFLQPAKSVVTTVKPVFTLQCNEFPIANLYQLYGSTAKAAFLQTAATASTLSCANVAPGDVLQYTVAMTNTGQDNAIAIVLRDTATGRENMDIDWRFRVGDVMKLRLVNDRSALHAMQHPIHIHGQRFLVVSVNGVPNENLVWKDTVLVPTGFVVDILVDMSNPGKWMLHCHIAEHVETGMRMVFEVTP